MLDYNFVELYKEFLDLQNQFESTLDVQSKLRISKELDRISEKIDSFELAL